MLRVVAFAWLVSCWFLLCLILFPLISAAGGVTVVFPYGVGITGRWEFGHKRVGHGCGVVVRDAWMGSRPGSPDLGAKRRGRNFTQLGHMPKNISSPLILIVAS